MAATQVYLLWGKQMASIEALELCARVLCFSPQIRDMADGFFHSYLEQRCIKVAGADNQRTAG